MKPLFTTVAVATFMVLNSTVPASASTTPAWKVARQAVLPVGGTGLPQGYLPTLSCVSAGNCEAGGAYDTLNASNLGLILNERRGSWTTPITLKTPAGAAANTGVTIYGLSCGALGNCAAVGSYQDRASDVLAFVDSEVNNVWSAPNEVSLPANALRIGQSAFVHSVACPSAGNCTAVGSYLDDNTTPHNVGFTLSEVNGTWGNPLEISLPPDANTDPFVTMSQVACASVGNCVATGSFIDDNNVNQALVVDQVSGVWSVGEALLPPPAASAYAGTTLSELTCVRDSSCTVLGTFNDTAGAVQGLIDSETNGQWPRATEIVMPSNAAKNPNVVLYGYQGIACASRGNCATGGQYKDAAGNYQGFLVDEVRGAWKRAVELSLPSGATAAGKNGGVVALSCPSAGNCRAGAAYLDASQNYQALVVTEVNGTWRRGVKVALPNGANTVGVDGGVYSLVCTSSSSCTATGSYLQTSTVYQGFTLNA